MWIVADCQMSGILWWEQVELSRFTCYRWNVKHYCVSVCCDGVVCVQPVMTVSRVSCGLIKPLHILQMKCETLLCLSVLWWCGVCAASDDCKPCVLWSLYFNVDNSSLRDLTSAVDNIVVVSGPDELMDYDNAIAEVTDASMCCLVKVDSKHYKTFIWSVKSLMIHCCMQVMHSHNHCAYTVIFGYIWWSCEK